MAIGCSGQIIKILLVLFNIVVSLASLGLIVIGIWFLVDDRVVNFFGVVSDPGMLRVIKAAAAVILVVGFISLLIGLVGCWGAVKQKTSFLIIYAIIIVLIILLEIAGAILAGVFHSEITKDLKHSMNNTMQNDYGKVDAATKSWNLLQYDLACCGVEGPHDWQTSFWRRNHTEPVPKTCCVLTNGNVDNPEPVNETKCYEAVGSNSTSEEYLHHDGCEKKLESWINGHLAILIGIAVAVIVVEVLVVVLACVLRARISGGYEYV